jgi:hypothetical protein
MVEYKMGRCHCGAIKFRVKLENGIGELRRCNCSICRRKGAVMGSVKTDQFELLEGQNSLTEYRWSSNVAQHFFCNTCGIYTHHKRKSCPDEYAFNVGCIDDIQPFEESNIVRLDGASI